MRSGTIPEQVRLTWSWACEIGVQCMIFWWPGAAAGVGGGRPEAGTLPPYLVVNYCQSTLPFMSFAFSPLSPSPSPSPSLPSFLHHSTPFAIHFTSYTLSPEHHDHDSWFVQMITIMHWIRIHSEGFCYIQKGFGGFDPGSRTKQAKQKKPPSTHTQPEKDRQSVTEGKAEAAEEEETEDNSEGTVNTFKILATNKQKKPKKKGRYTVAHLPRMLIVYLFWSYSRLHTYTHTDTRHTQTQRSVFVWT